MRHGQLILENSGDDPELSPLLVPESDIIVTAPGNGLQRSDRGDQKYGGGNPQDKPSQILGGSLFHQTS